MKIRTRFKYLKDLAKIASKDDERKNINGVNIYRHSSGGIFLTALNGYCFGRYFDASGDSDGNYTINADRLIKGLTCERREISDYAVIEISDNECVLKETYSSERVICQTKEVYLQTEEFPNCDKLMPKTLIPLLTYPASLKIALDRKFIELMPGGYFDRQILNFYAERPTPAMPAPEQDKCFSQMVYVLTNDASFIGAIMPCRGDKDTAKLDKAFGVEIIEISYYPRPMTDMVNGKV